MTVPAGLCVSGAALLALAISCAGPSPGPASTAPRPSARPPELAAHTPAAGREPAVEDPDAMVDAGPPAAPFRWSPVAGCPLTYDHRVTYRTEAAGMGFRTGLEISGQLAARPAAADPKNVTLAFQWVRMDVLGPGGPVKGTRTDENLGSVEIATDGVRWTVREKPRPTPVILFQPAGIERIWPTLPAGVAVGSEVKWDVPAHSEGGLAGALAMVAAQPMPKIESATLRIKRWVRVRGDLACVIEGTWDQEQTTEQKQRTERTRTRTSLRGAAHFVVLASGRLLRAHVRQAVDVAMVHMGQEMLDGVESGMPATQDTHTDVTSELRLVRACDGATITGLHPPPTLDEQALVVHSKLVGALVKGDRAGVTAAIGPELARTHGVDAVTDLLFKHIKRYGDHAIGFGATTPGSIRTIGDRVEMPMTAFVRTTTGADSAIALLVMEKKGDAVRLRSIKVTVGTGDTATDVLEVTDSRLHFDPDRKPK